MEGLSQRQHAGVRDCPTTLRLPTQKLLGFSSKLRALRGGDQGCIARAVVGDRLPHRNGCLHAWLPFSFPEKGIAAQIGPGGHFDT
jgi:hypothetical protein